MSRAIHRYGMFSNYALRSANSHPNGPKVEKTCFKTGLSALRCFLRGFLV